MNRLNIAPAAGNNLCNFSNRSNYVFYQLFLSLARVSNFNGTENQNPKLQNLIGMEWRENRDVAREGAKKLRFALQRTRFVAKIPVKQVLNEERSRRRES